MNLSKKWLEEYIKLDVSPRQYAEDMTMSGSKVEGYRIEGSDISGVIVGKVSAIKPHDNADSLVVCTVDIGRDLKLQIVTGAKNLYEGAVVPVALDGAVLPNGTTIKTAPLRGIESQGMLCSLSELGLSTSDFPYADEQGIFILQEDCYLGQDIQSAIGLNDTVVEFEITSNRPDCLSVLGLARETAATYGKHFAPPTPVVKGSGDNISNYLKVEVQNPTLCPRYVAKVVKNIKIAPSPRWMRERLRASGVRPINNIVDITNYVMLEYGQPLHAFDHRFVKDATIIVRNANEGECITTLDSVERRLSPEMLVIADGAAATAVAGVMGGEFSSIVEDTSTIILESANFLGSAVRTTAKKLGMRTESSGRFEKGLDPNTCIAAALRACELIEQLGAGEVVDGTIDVDHSQRQPTMIELDHHWINSFLGICLNQQEMAEILQRVGFCVEGNQITVPSFRADVAHKADIAEEVARFYGYNKIPTTSIRGSVEGALTQKQRFERLVTDTLIGCGLNEIVTYTFISPKYYDKFGIPTASAKRRCVVITNPLGEDTSIMRTDALPSMMEILARNYNNRNRSAALFELAKEFYPAETIHELPEENTVITLGLYGTDASFFTLKGILEKLLTTLGIRGYDVSAVMDNPSFHPGRTAQLTLQGTQLALLGQLHPMVAANYDVEVPVYLAKISLKDLMAHAAFDRVYRPLPKFPASSRDLAIICDSGLPVLAIEKAIRRAIPQLLEELTLFDVYKGAQVAAGKKSVAYNITLRAQDHTLTEAELSSAIAATLDELALIGAELRV